MKKQPEVTDMTRKTILEAFWIVYQQKTLAHITIKDIAETAHIHRSTFYRYFTDIHDLLNQFEQNLLNEILRTVEKARGTWELTDLVSHADVMAGVLKEYAPMIHHLTSPNGDSGFRLKLRCLMQQFFYQFSLPIENKLEADYLFHFIFTNILANLNFWYEHREDYTLEQIGGLSKRLLSGSVTEYVNNLK